STHLFMGKVSEAIPVLYALTHKQDRSESKHGGAALEYRLIYRKTPQVNDWLVIRSGLRQLGSKTVTWAHWMFNQKTGECMATAEAVAISLDLEKRRAIDMPPEVRDKLQPYLNLELSI
ncbi:MAG: thioesterase family protein, partial [Pseudomonadota bacterium]